MIKAWKFDVEVPMPKWVECAFNDGRIFYKPTTSINIVNGLHVPSVEIMPANTSWICRVGEYLYLERGHIFRAPSSTYLTNMFGEENVTYVETPSLSM